MVNVIDDITELKRAERASRVLAEASELLTSSMDYERTLQAVAEMAVAELADWCAVAMPDALGLIQQVRSRPLGPRQGRAGPRAARTLPGANRLSGRERRGDPGGRFPVGQRDS